MARAEIREFFYKEGLIHFDETPCEKFSLAEDLTDEVWYRFRRRARIPADMEVLTALENLHLVKDGKMTHAGAWLLARDITKFNTSAAVACALFMGTDKVRILDRRGFSEDIYSMIDHAMDWILSKINVEYVIIGWRSATTSGMSRRGCQWRLLKKMKWMSGPMMYSAISIGPTRSCRRLSIYSRLTG